MVLLLVRNGEFAHMSVRLCLQSGSMELLTADFTQKRPTSAQARAMCQQVSLEIRPLFDPRLDSVINRIRDTHANGGVLFASFDVGANKTFDWFASRGRLLELGILRLLLDRAEINRAIPALEIQPSKSEDPAFAVRTMGEIIKSESPGGGMSSESPEFAVLRDLEIGDDYELGDCAYDGNFRATSSFLFDGELAQALYSGGAYTSAVGNGRAEKENSLLFCEALFGLRLSEVWYGSSHSAWTPWFGNIAWDWTAILFDRRLRALSILAITDTD